MILAIETATEICSVSFQDKSGEIFEKRITRKGSHSEYLFLFIRELMEEHRFKIQDLDALLLSNGPGSYTGLRIGASAVKGLLFNSEIDLYSGNTLAGFAAAVVSAHENSLKNEQRIHAVINARRSHLYHQQFTFDGVLQSKNKPELKEIEQIEEIISPGDFIVGTGINRLNETTTEECILYGTEMISANALIQLFRLDSENEYFTKMTAETLESNYISSSQVNNSKIN